MVSRILGPLCAAKHEAFTAALLFAQDYGILAASIQDRPFVPHSKVAVHGVPREVKAAFRGVWEDPLGMNSHDQEEGVKILRLDSAIAALRR